MKTISSSAIVETQWSQKSSGTDSAPCACLLKEQRDVIEIETEKISSTCIIAGAWYLVLITAQGSRNNKAGFSEYDWTM